MIALIQRVTAAEVSVAGISYARIDTGLLAFIGIRPEDGAAEAATLLDRVLDYRVFADEAGRMNRSLRDLGGGLLLVPQFTLAADTRKGLRPGFSTAAAPQQAEALFASLVARARHLHPTVGAGRFGEHMQVSLINDGPVTFWLES
jgi:D-aminoacyl-tRNA deacylase